MKDYFKLIFSALLILPVKLNASGESGYQGDYEIQDKNPSNVYQSPFKTNDIYRKKISAETIQASSQVVVGIVQSQSSIRMVPAAYGALIVSTGTFDLFIATGLCDSCWRKVRVAQ